MTTETPLPSKRPATPLAGPYGHPFHPVLVTVPIGAWVAALVFDLAARLVDDPAVLAEGSYWLLWLGVIGAVVAGVWGTMDLLTIPNNTKAWGTGIRHAILNTVAIVVFGIAAALRQSEGRQETSTTATIVIVAGLLVIGVSGWLGGKMSYTYGVRVAREGDQAEAYRR